HRIGVYILGAGVVNHKEGFRGVHVVTQLDQPGRDAVQAVAAIRAALASGEPLQHGCLPSSAPLHLDEGLWACSLAFSALKSTQHRVEDKRVWVFTDDAAPGGGDGEGLPALLRRSEHLRENQTTVYLYPFTDFLEPGAAGAGPDTLQGTSFDMRQWAPILRANLDIADSDGDCVLDALDQRVFAQARGGGGAGEALAEDMRSRLHKKRVYAKLPLVLPTGQELALGVYKNVAKARKPSAVKVRSGAYDVPVKSSTRYVCRDTGRSLGASDMGKVACLGATEVELEPDTVRAVKTLSKPGLALLGTRALSSVPLEHTVEAPLFVFPHEALVSGSTAAFIALHRALVAQERVGIVRFVPREGAPPVLAALVPAHERVDVDSRRQVEPAGMYIVRLPFADDIRLNVPVPDTPAAVSDASVQAAEALIQRLSLPAFHPSQSDNPVLQKWFSSTEALALGQERTWNEEQDLLRPDTAALEGAAEQFAEWQAAVAADAGEGLPPPSLAVGGVKRSQAAAGASGEAAGSQGKRARVDSVDAPDHAAVVAQHAAGKLSKYTVPLLKAILKRMGAPTSGRKADLVQRLESLLA
ncbi:XRCC6, partial [Symbiodinium sp. KB8]